jgi:hypothetical protein
MAEKISPVKNRNSDKVFVTPIDHQYSQHIMKSKEEDQSIINDFNDINNMVDDIIKDCYEEEISEFEGVSTNSASPLVKNLRLYQQKGCQFLPEPIDFLPKKGKLLKTANFIKKNWKNKLVTFKDVLTKKIMSKFQVYMNKSKSYGNTPECKFTLNNFNNMNQFDFPSPLKVGKRSIYF